MEPGDVCEAGGIEVSLGTDSNLNGELDDDEISETEVICNGVDGEDGADGEDGTDGEDGADGADGADGEDGASSLIQISDEDPGDNCEAGGQRVDVGLDNGDGDETAGDGLLGEGEIDSTHYVCDGVDGFTVLTNLVEAPAGGSCDNGGQRLDIGLDNGDGGETAHDGVLGAGEIDQARYICNGADGADGEDGATGPEGPQGPAGSDGSDGHDTLIDQSPVSSGANCAYGGVRVDSGLDNGDGGGTADNGVLEADEIDSTSYLCNGADAQGGGVKLSDASGFDLGTVVSADDYGITVLSTTGYIAWYGWDGDMGDGQYYFSGSSCTQGTAYLNSGSNDPQKMYAKSVYYHPRSDQLLVPSNIGGDGMATSVGNLSPGSFDNYGSCSSPYNSSGHGWAMQSISASAAGVKMSPSLPLTLQ